MLAAQSARIGVVEAAVAARHAGGRAFARHVAAAALGDQAVLIAHLKLFLAHGALHLLVVLHRFLAHVHLFVDDRFLLDVDALLHHRHVDRLVGVQLALAGLRRRARDRRALYYDALLGH